MARFVPERSDDFVFENNLIAGRFYGEAFEGSITSPGIDVWVKLPGALVANEWYNGLLTESEEFYYHDHGGKDCYDATKSLGGGASAPMVHGLLRYPATNFRSWEIVESKPEKVVFKLYYPTWDIPDSVKVSLVKTVTVVADSYFCDVEDIYTFEGAPTIDVAAGITLHKVQDTVDDQLMIIGRCVAIWEQASDQTYEPEEGRLGVAVVMSGSDYTGETGDGPHLVLARTITSGEPIHYRFGSCWSKGDIQTDRQWFNLVTRQ